jgi:hypothetical protein
MLRKKLAILLCCSALFGTGCGANVLRQDIPVSTSPMGARIYADGTLVGQTPATVSLERTRDHILTLVKDNYRQQDVAVTRQYQSDRVVRNAVIAGVNSGLFFKDKRMGVSSGLGSFSRQEETGEAYILVPATVSVSLAPLDAAATPWDSAAAVSPPAPADAGNPATGAIGAGLAAGAAIGAAQTKPIGKEWQTSSSSSSYVQPDGTKVTRKSSTSVGVSVDPAGLVKTLDALFN